MRSRKTRVSTSRSTARARTRWIRKRHEVGGRLTTMSASRNSEAAHGPFGRNSPRPLRNRRHTAPHHVWLDAGWETLLRRYDRKPASTARAVDREVPPIEREDAREIFALGDAHQRRVGEVHWQVAVLLHQLAHARRIAFVERRQRQRPGFHTAPEGLLTTPRRTQQVHGLGE